VIPVRDLRDRIAVHLAGVLTPGGWRESSYPLELMPLDPRADQHRAWAVAIPTTLPDRQDRQRGRGAVARYAEATSTVQVGWSWWLRPDAVALDYAEALGAEAVLVAHALTVQSDPALTPILGSMRRRVLDGDGGALLLGVVEFEVHHLVPLALP